MNGKNLLEGRNGPVSQSLDSVKALLTWKGRGCDPMPSTLEFVNEGEGSYLVLVQSNKKDSYYVVTPTKCSCPAGYPCHLPTGIDEAMTKSWWQFWVVGEDY